MKIIFLDVLLKCSLNRCRYIWRKNDNYSRWGPKEIKKIYIQRLKSLSFFFYRQTMRMLTCWFRQFKRSWTKGQLSILGSHLVSSCSCSSCHSCRCSWSSHLGERSWVRVEQLLLPPHQSLGDLQSGWSGLGDLLGWPAIIHPTTKTLIW